MAWFLLGFTSSVPEADGEAKLGGEARLGGGLAGGGFVGGGLGVKEQGLRPR
jgi:hypothetical protein